MNTSFSIALSVCKLVVLLGLLAACLLPPGTIPGLAEFLKYTGMLLAALGLYKIYKTGNLGWGATAKDAVARSEVDLVAAVLVIAQQLVNAFVL